MKLKTVRVYVYGGVVQNMDIPHGVRVELYDGDIDGTEENLVEDPHGNTCTGSTWYPDGTNASGVGKRH